MSERKGIFVTRGALLGLVVSWVAILVAFVWLGLTSATVDNLHKTDQIACRFLKDDSTIRLAQNESTRTNQLMAETQFLADSDQFLALFAKVPKNKVTPSVVVFRNYVAAERSLVQSIRDGTRVNVQLSQQLAATGTRLAKQLHC